MSSLASLQTDYTTIMGDSLIVDKRASIDGIVSSLQTTADTERGTLLAAKDNTYTDWLAKNDTIAGLLVTKN